MSTEDNIAILETMKMAAWCHTREEREAISAGIEALRKLEVLGPMLKRIDDQLPKKKEAV